MLDDSHIHHKTYAVAPIVVTRGLISVCVVLNMSAEGMQVQSTHEELYGAIDSDDVDTLKSLLLVATESDINFQDESGDTALMRACSAGSLRIVETLLTYPSINANLQAQQTSTWERQRRLMMGAKRVCMENNSSKRSQGYRSIDVNIQNKKGESALMKACWRGDTSVIQALLNSSRDVNVNAQNKRGDTALMRASSYGHITVVSVLLARPDVEVNLQSKNGDTALMCACAGSHADVVKMLLASQRCVDANIINKEGKSALDLVAREDIRVLLSSYNELCHAVKKEDADRVRSILAVATDSDVNVRDEDGNTALVLACAQGCTRIVEMLLQHPGIDVNSKGENEETPLTSASSWDGYKHCIREGSGTRTVPTKADCSQYPIIVEMLLAQPNIDVNSQNNRNKKAETALMKACLKGCCDVVAMLLAHPNTDINMQDMNGWTALMKAVGMRRVQVVGMLLARSDIDVNLRAQNGYTAFMYAAMSTTEIAKMLMGDLRTELNSLSQGEDTALSISIFSHSDFGGMTQTLLVNPRIDVNVQDENGWTVLMKTCDRCYSHAAKWLLDHPDIDVKLRNKDGKTALDLTTRDERIKVMLRDYFAQYDDSGEGDEEQTAALPLPPNLSSPLPPLQHLLPPLSPPAPVMPPAAEYLFGADKDGESVLIRAFQEGQPDIESIQDTKNQTAAVLLLAPAPMPHTVQMTEAERQAMIDEMMDVFENVQEVDASGSEGEDEVSEMGDTTVREADTVVGAAESVMRSDEEDMPGEMDRLRAENYLLRNNFPSAGRLHHDTGTTHNLHSVHPAHNSNNNNIEGDCDDSVQTKTLFLPESQS